MKYFIFYKYHLEIELISTNKVGTILRIFFHMDILGKINNVWWPKRKKQIVKTFTYKKKCKVTLNMK